MVFDALVGSDAMIGMNSGQAGMGNHWYKCPNGHICKCVCVSERGSERVFV